MLNQVFLVALTGFLVGTRAVAIDITNRAVSVNPRDGAIPDDTSAGFVVLSWEDIPDVGNLTYWGPESPSSGTSTGTTATPARDAATPGADALGLGKRCGSNAAQACSASHQASTSQCQQLVRALAAGANASVGASPRSICLASAAAGACCVSWHNAAPGLVRGDLLPAARVALVKCGGKGKASDKVNDVNLAGTCTQQCLSNRPDGC